MNPREAVTLKELDELWEEVETRTRPAWAKAFEAGDKETEKQAHEDHQNLLQKILDNATAWKSSFGESPILQLPREQRPEAKAKVEEACPIGVGRTSENPETQR